MARASQHRVLKNSSSPPVSYGMKEGIAFLVGCTGQVRALPTFSGILPQEADSASGGSFRQIPPLPVTSAFKK